MDSQDGRPLVQAPMESPLNLAHTFSRRADMLTKNRKYEEAIDCHRKAAEFLLLAMKTATSPTLLESMALQHKVYLSQIDRLHAKNQLLELMDRNTKTTATVSRATQTDGIQSMETTEQVLDEDTIYQTLRENDELLSQVCLRDSQKSDSSQVSLVSDKSCSLSEGDATDTLVNDKSPSASKVIKPEGGILAEGAVSLDDVVKMNEKLSQAVRSLLQELGSTRAEKKQMEEKLGDSQEILKQGSEGTLKFSSLDLPPLEVSYPELGNFNLPS